MTHYSTVGPASTLAEQIVDQVNDDGNPAYGIDRAFGLIDEDQDNQPGKAESNADNYAWVSQTREHCTIMETLADPPCPYRYMAQLAWVSYTCSGDQDTYDTFFPLTPDDYED